MKQLELEGALEAALQRASALDRTRARLQHELEYVTLEMERAQAAGAAAKKKQRAEYEALVNALEGALEDALEGVLEGMEKQIPWSINRWSNQVRERPRDRGRAGTCLYIFG